jgi:N-acetylmuramoyl-L-alanine amidase
VKAIIRPILVLVVLFGFAAPSPALFPQTPTLQLAVEDLASSARVTLTSEVPIRSSIERNDAYLLIRIRIDQPFRIQRQVFQSRFIESIGWSQGSDFYILNIKTMLAEFSHSASTLSDPHRLVIDILPPGAESPPKPDPAADEGRPTKSKDEEEAPPPSDDRTNEGTEPESGRPRQLPSQQHRTIVIDPGHGGLETGAVGSLGSREKDITLPLSQMLKSIIERNLAYRVVLTRDRDVDVPLERRAAIANNERAFVFISLHANGFQGRQARGAETYFLSLNATDEEARRLAYMENNSSELEVIGGDSDDDIKMILWDMAQANYLKQSSQLAELIQNELNTLRGTLNRGVKQAPYKVLTGVACPAVLVEVAFLSNPDEERKLMTAEFQSSVALAIYSGLAKYIRRLAQE